MNAPQPRAGILDIAPYQPGESKISGRTRVIKLASNETPLGPAPGVADAIRGGLAHLHLYPDSRAAALCEALADAHGLQPSRIMCSAGSEEMIHMLARAYAGPGDEVIYSEYGFIAYPIAIRSAGATPVIAKERAFTADVDAILNAVTERTKIVFLANPNNPTGTFLSDAEVRRLHAGLPGHVLLVLDEAYSEYVNDAEFRSGLALARDAENVVVTRTFSKIYGLAALRVGWSYCPETVIDVLNRVRCTFNVTALAQRAALAALQDHAHIAKARAHNDRWLPWVSDTLRAIGIEVSPSLGNFILSHFRDGDTARKADAHLRADGIIVRPVAGYGLSRQLRITIGREDENRALCDSLNRFMKAA